MKEYDAVIGGIDHTFQLNDEDAKLRGLDPAKDGRAIKASVDPTAKAKRAAAPQNKAAGAGDDK